MPLPSPISPLLARLATGLLIALTACGEPTRVTAPAALTPSSNAGMSLGAEPAVISAQIVTAGQNHTCAILTSGPTYCWGWNLDGQLGDGTTTDRAYATQVATQATFTRLTAGVNHNCGITAQGAVYCWGWGAVGQLGNGTVSSSSVPVEVLGGVRFKRVAAGGSNTCGLTEHGEVYCWGFINGLGPVTSPMKVSGTLTFRSISVGWEGCGIGTDWKTYCFLTSTRFGNAGEPVFIPSPAFTSIYASVFSTCGLTAAGAAHCMGINFNGLLGAGIADNSLNTGTTMVPVAGNHVFRTLGFGHDRACGITRANETWCWGSNGDLTFNGPYASFSPIPVKTSNTQGLTFINLDLGNSHTCGLSTNSSVYCWGAFQLGQRGDGLFAVGQNVWNIVPVAVRRGP